MLKENGKIGIVVFFVVILVIIIICAGSFMWYTSSLKAIQKNSQKVEIVINDGTSTSQIAEKLENSGVIRSATAFKVYCKLEKKNSLMAGKYEFDKNMSVHDIVDRLTNGAIVDDSVTITFIEGKGIESIAKTIANNTNNTEEDIYKLLEDEEYIDSLIDEYWFITKEIKNDYIYYSLEGYLYPDTYTFANKDVDVKEIFKIMLDAMDSQLSQYKSEINKSDYSVHELLTLASIVELEALNEDDRAIVAGVFYNRLNAGMALQSDVTTYYGLRKNMGDGDLTASDLAKNNPYNTRASNMAGKLPVGPICMPSASALKAVIEPEDSKYLFFVADSKGQVHYSRTNSEHEALIKDLKDKGLWYTY